MNRQAGDIEEGPQQLPPVIESEELNDTTSPSTDPRQLNDGRSRDESHAGEGSETSHSETMTLNDSFVSQNSDVVDDEGRRVRIMDSSLSSNRGMVRTGGRHAINEPNMRLSQQGQHCQIRHVDTKHAMDENSRRMHRWRANLSRFLKKDDANEEEDDIRISMHGRLMVQPSRRIFNNQPTRESSDDEEDIEAADDDNDEKKREETQYRLTTMKRKRRGRKNVLSIPGMYEDLATGEASDCCWFCPCPNLNSDRAMSAFLHWSFRSPFVVVFGSAAIGWLALTFVFALAIYLLGELDGDCVGGVDFGNSTAPFTDAYQLSWTTFSTVGYGLVYPSTSANHAQIHQCTVITILTCFESFVGVLFSSLCAALMFAKVARVQSFAQVTFSDPMVIRYGTGVTAEDGDDEDEEEGSGNKDNGSKIPCPILEFRVFNRMSDIQGGEIIDATLNMVAVIDVSQADPTLMAKHGRRRKKGKKKRGPTRNQKSHALRYQRGRQRSATDVDKPKSEDTVDSVASAGESSAEETDPPNATTRLETEQALRHRSVVACDSVLPTTGPAPAIARTNPASQQLAKTPVAKRQSAVQIQHKPELLQGDRQHGWGNSSGSTGMHMPFTRKKKGHRKRKQDNKFFHQQNLNQVSMNTPVNQQFEEDPDGKILPKKMLSKLEVETQDHPFFRRIWLVRHTLDLNSLLLKPHVRQMLERNNGFWPSELNNYESIRASLDFDQILISLSGTSNADANSVYSQHVYHMVDVNVGYRFVNALYRDPNDGSLRVDQTLINDVMEQAGGGGEPLNEFEAKNFADIMVL